MTRTRFSKRTLSIVSNGQWKMSDSFWVVLGLVFLGFIAIVTVAMVVGFVAMLVVFFLIEWISQWTSKRKNSSS